jgi:hypothetical protein
MVTNQRPSISEPKIALSCISHLPASPAFNASYRLAIPHCPKNTIPSDAFLLIIPRLGLYIDTHVPKLDTDPCEERTSYREFLDCTWFSLQVGVMCHINWYFHALHAEDFNFDICIVR